MNKPVLIAHRGDTKNFSENTIEAFQSAFDLGAYGVEFDVHLTDKGELIVVHDFLYDRTKMYPFLSEVLEKFSQRGRLEIEIKSFNLDCIEKVSELIKKYNVKDYEITSSILPLLSEIKRIIPGARTGMIFNQKFFESWMTPEIRLMVIKGYLGLTKVDVLHLDFGAYTPELITKLHDDGYILHTHLKTADRDIFNKVKELGIDQCSFDDINLVKVAGGR